METVKKRAHNVTRTQIKAIMDFMQENEEVAKGFIHSTSDKDYFDAQWKNLTTTLNSLGGAVKSIEQWKKTWQYLKHNPKKRVFKTQKNTDDTNIQPKMESLDGSVDQSQNSQNANDDDSEMPSKKRYSNHSMDESEVPSKKNYVSFDEEIVKIERDKLELEREYKIQKIEVLSRIAAALEELANK